MSDQRDPNAWHHEPASNAPDSAGEPAGDQSRAAAAPQMQSAIASRQSHSWVWIIVALIIGATVVTCVALVSNSSSSDAGADGQASAASTSADSDEATSDATSDAATEATTQTVTTTAVTEETEQPADGMRLREMSYFKPIGGTSDVFAEAVHAAYQSEYEAQGDFDLKLEDVRDAATGKSHDMDCKRVDRLWVECTGDDETVRILLAFD